MPSAYFSISSHTNRPPISSGMTMRGPPLMPFLLASRDTITQMTVRTGWRIFVMAAATDKNIRSGLIIFTLILTAFVSFFLNYPDFYIPIYKLWRVGDPALLIIGVLGSAIRNKPLRVVGWLGIWWFVPVSIFASMPNLDHPALNANGDQTLSLWLWKFGLALSLSISLVVCYRKLALKPPPTLDLPEVFGPTSSADGRRVR